MGAGRRKERRKLRHTGLKLEHSFLFHIPRRIAWALILSLLAIIASVEVGAPRQFWFGPIYLSLIALATWSLGVRAALSIGVTILTIKLATGGFSLYPYGGDLLLPNLLARIFAVVVVVTFIGMARKSCEREWLAARTDPLTKAFNRQAFFEIVKGSRTVGEWAALIYADLDGLKRLNDEEGHERGDQSIKAFAQTVRKTIRKDDVFARLGGDEFVIFMKLKDEASGEAVARRLHQAINMTGEDDSSNLHCSLGVLVLPDGSQSIDAELRAADELMYEAKKSRSGAFVATAWTENGVLVLSPGVRPAGLPERESSIRKADRENPSGTGERGDKPFRSGPRAAA